MSTSGTQAQAVSTSNAAIFFIQSKKGHLIDVRDKLRKAYPDEYVRVVVGQPDANLIFVKFGLSGFDELRSDPLSWVENQDSVANYSCCVGSCIHRSEDAPRFWGMTQHLVFRRKDLPSSARGAVISALALKETNPMMVLNLSGFASSVVVYSVDDSNWSEMSDNSEWWSNQGYANLDYVCP